MLEKEVREGRLFFADFGDQLDLGCGVHSEVQTQFYKAPSASCLFHSVTIKEEVIVDRETGLKHEVEKAKLMPLAIVLDSKSEVFFCPNDSQEVWLTAKAGCLNSEMAKNG